MYCQQVIVKWFRHWHGNQEVPGSMLSRCYCCFLEQETIIIRIDPVDPAVLLGNVRQHLWFCIHEQETSLTLIQLTHLYNEYQASAEKGKYWTCMKTCCSIDMAVQDKSHNNLYLLLNRCYSFYYFKFDNWISNFKTNFL